MLRLHVPAQEAPLAVDQRSLSGELKLDKRMFPRKVLDQQMTAVYTDEDGQRGMTRIGIIDGSWVGLGAISPKRLDVGTVLDFCAPGVPVLTRRGEVVRCEPVNTGYRLGIRLEAKRLG
jgi:hypothetical protein